MKISKLFVMLLIAGALATAAWSGGKSEQGAAGKNAQGVTDTEILVANSTAVSGAWATTGDPIVAGIKAYFDMVNAGGGIDGRTIKFLHTDDEFDAVKAKAAFQKFYEDDKVFGLVGVFGQVPVAAILDDLHESGMPAVYFASSISQLYIENAKTLKDGANCYPIQPIYVTEARVMVARAAADFKAKKIGIIYTNDETGSDLHRGAEIETKELGLQLTGVQIQAGASDVSAAVTTLKNAGVDFVIVGGAQTTMPTVVKELAKQNVNKPAFITFVTSVRAMAEQVAPDIKGKFDVYSTGWMNFEGERWNNLLEAQKWLPDTYDMNGYAFCGWVGAHFFCEGLRRLEGKPVTWDSYRQAMESAPLTIPFGGTVNYANGARLGTQEMTLVKLDLAAPTGFAEVDGFRSFEELLSRAKK
jgi:ABC-type branched-subunit amino acid transport system substrate-binding protein